jgi:transposase
MTEIAIEKKPGVFQRYRVPTSILAIRQVLDGVPGHKQMAIEEGPMADWLYRNLKDAVDKLTVCDPRRNRLVACDGDKNDTLDASKLAELDRGCHLRPVYHSDSRERVQLKRWVALYLDRVKSAVREINKLRARCRMEGLRPPRGTLTDKSSHESWLKGLEDRALAGQLEVLWIGYDAVREQVHRARKEIVRLSRLWPIIGRWQEIPGVGLIRAATFFAYMDTPFRFPRKSKVWKYSGVGLMRRSSGTGRNGVPNPGVLRLAFAVNRQVKNAVMGAAISAIQQKNNVFADHYERMVQEGKAPSNARHTVARKIVSVMWGMWKTDRPFDPSLAGSREDVPSGRRKGGGRKKASQ